MRVLTRRLVRQLNEALAAGHVFIEAPAGFGKTLLLEQLEQHRPQSHLVRLEAADSDPAVLRPRLEPLLQPGRTLLLDDIHHLAGGAEAVAWLQAQMTQGPARFVAAGRGLPFDPAWLAEMGHRAACLNSADLAFDDDECLALRASSTLRSGSARHNGTVS